MRYRTCPSCNEKSISLAKLALFGRPKCTECSKSVGFHWLFAALYACFLAVFSGFIGLYLVASNINVIFSFIIIFAVVFVVSTLASVVAPLETKSKWWAP